MKMVHDEIRKGPWTEQEDLQLACFVSLFGERRWDFIAKVSGLNRTGKSCRLRWVNYLHPGLKRGKMTPQEERLVLELHSRWGNRWSRIARRLPGRTDNEIKNYWRTHMRKKAQERKQAMSPSLSSSHCSSQSGNNHVVDSLPNTQIKEGSLHDKECPGIDLSVRGGESEEEEEAAKGYSMDQIWKEIASLEDESSREVYDKYREDGGNFSYSPMGPSLWDYCADSLWRMEGEEIKMLLPMADHFVSCYEHTTAS